jgi:hypothetical protein
VDAAGDTFCDQMQSELDEPLGGAKGEAHESSSSWQHGRCATHTLQLSVRAGLAVEPVCDLLDKVRLVAKLCRTSTKIQRQLDPSAAAESRAAERSGSVRTATVHRRTLDCPTRWGSTLVMVERSWRVVSEVPAALSAYRSQASTGKKEVEALNVQQRSPMRDFRPGAKCPMPVNRQAMCLGLTCAIVTSLVSSDLDRAKTRSCTSFQNTQISPWRPASSFGRRRVCTLLRVAPPACSFLGRSWRQLGAQKLLQVGPRHRRLHGRQGRHGARVAPDSVLGYRTSEPPDFLSAKVHSGGAKLDAAGGPPVEESILHEQQAVPIPAVQLEIIEPAEQLVSQVLEHDSDGRLSTGSSADLSVQDWARWVHAVGGYKGLALLRVLVQSEVPIAFRKVSASIAS